MEQPQQNYNELILRQLERFEHRVEERFSGLEQRIRLDAETLRKDLVAHDTLDLQLNEIRRIINRVDSDRINDKDDLKKEIKELETEKISKQDRLWIRLGQLAGFAALALVLFEFLIHFKYFP